MYSGMFQIWDVVFTPALVSDIFSANVNDVTSSLSTGLLLDWGWGAYTTTSGVRRYDITSGLQVVIQMFICISIPVHDHIDC